MMPALEGTASADVGASQKLTTACWMLTSSCNMTCPMCHAYSDEPSADFNRKVAIVDAIAALGTRFVVLGGGEPLLDADFLRVCSYIRKRGLELLVNTNGILLGPALQEQLGILGAFIGLPLDGSTPGVHALMRGSAEHHTHVVNTIRDLGRLRVRFDVSTVVTRANSDDMVRTADLLTKLEVSTWRLNRFSPLGRGATTADEYAISDVEFDHVVSEARSHSPSMRMLVRTSNSERLLAYFLVTPQGMVRIAKAMRHVTVASLLADSDIPTRLTVAGFRFDLNKATSRWDVGGR